jgi:hypothetical protein
MNKCIGCPNFRHIRNRDEWDCTAPYKRCRKEEMETEEPLDVDYGDIDDVDTELLEPDEME